jgi:hypothetical protein
MCEHRPRSLQACERTYYRPFNTRVLTLTLKWVGRWAFGLSPRLEKGVILTRRILASMNNSPVSLPVARWQSGSQTIPFGHQWTVTAFIY